MNDAALCETRAKQLRTGLGCEARHGRAAEIIEARHGRAAEIIEARHGRAAEIIEARHGRAAEIIEGPSRPPRRGDY
ncbi:hypothetical protein WME75_36220 [Sorangium sp. So ce1014]|uniref:hypothetical protein n=1 Tax=Sorangium sp. So ce1014 TaxID=3133326 RepID=UPI003F5DB459